ncbi:hypothetical protein A1Q1_00663 [Trichosporon asahii var. asahii CBS 2479]|uniref:Uncharacterized protein n=1 Tax=Trichosporon asahii var. asahii (strain ATCC 90039 / CBS 2479 / JCM 2466 / KCTC 7840 / NBRC 103889/ NCYC 2677 / UAMH 7654) TaxID=1186058 RepID=J5TUG3_TRIAS|nr:hypothetical protein A1Q1_00663 [Trichosporon asahii var. asahii CBS 2479]EJT52916.1 hypothetical protein A1Q1_00663 [Trichosporon asahii var. asahii CBS 2479]
MSDDDTNTPSTPELTTGSTASGASDPTHDGEDWLATICFCFGECTCRALNKDQAPRDLPQAKLEPTESAHPPGWCSPPIGAPKIEAVPLAQPSKAATADVDTATAQTSLPLPVQPGQLATIIQLDSSPIDVVNQTDAARGAKCTLADAPASLEPHESLEPLSPYLSIHSSADWLYSDLLESLHNNAATVYRLPGPVNLILPNSVAEKYLNMAAERLYYTLRYVRSYNIRVLARRYAEIETEAEGLRAKLWKLGQMLHHELQNGYSVGGGNTYTGVQSRGDRIVTKMVKLWYELGRCDLSLALARHAGEKLCRINRFAKLIVWKEGGMTLVNPRAEWTIMDEPTLVEYSKELRWNIEWIEKEAEKLCREGMWTEVDMKLD